MSSAPILQQLADALGLSSISGAHALAGFSGGIVHIFWYKKTKPFDALSALVCGTLTAVYACDPISAQTGVPSGFVGFLIGVIGIQVLAPTIALIRDRLSVGKPGENQ